MVIHIFATVVFLCSCVAYGYVTTDGKTVPPLPAPSSNIVNVSTGPQLYMAVRNQAAGQTILIADGTYDVSTFEPLVIRVSNLTIRGASDDPDKAILVGKGMNNCIDVEEEILRLEGGAQAILANMMVTESRCHGLKFQNGNPSNVIIHNVHFLNIGERMIKGPSGVSAPSCSIRYCFFEDTTIPPPTRCGSNSIDTCGDYIAGMDIMGETGWVVHDNVFKNIRGPSGQARGAIFFWNGNQNMTVERNTFIGCDRSICFGNLSGTTASVTGGIIRNNFVIPGVSVGFELTDAVNIKVYNNTSFTSLTSGNGSLVYTRTSGCEVKNNIIFGSFTGTGPMPDTSHNFVVSRTQKTIVARWFLNEAANDLHLKTDTASAVNRGLTLADVTNDWDKLSRSDGQTDVGADELSNNPSPLIESIAPLFEKTYLRQPEPNPFNPFTIIRYGIAPDRANTPVSITVASMSGKTIRTLVRGKAVAGNHAVIWNGRDNVGNMAASGMYFIHLQSGVILTTKVILIK
ncbi:MAG: hypothetical protein A2268_12445 [Candidatus Raymondbacteria bacterium RifOxyA12_full_50_37]|nr:MAG: hypothetical protein A2268_12445 [Candidatus Raymondbacteria bacterium RifOxyA12_full_50_37]OGJ91347.1 MAG: hypothetical protein A2248_03940 [Candidatus Raymondbacteria bacterium RIFOXYA2_FULL_49_16]OGJ97748.1 MAG: hypothetical protein A2453_13780 [Candidatus Raymondbacteria bacterium RIFOXYC2_FULL_50_21]OGK00150.1 MAG: hypothetical protein A2487_09550 [Candidatus Raymondbacteria bacterium RifOxyC12_full_50_8]OGP43737.1 MAG: hypothetical protein A2324_15505 [Candidatus Raymondbacteria b